jgi:hypothetical protein
VPQDNQAINHKLTLQTTRKLAARQSVAFACRIDGNADDWRASAESFLMQNCPVVKAFPSAGIDLAVCLSRLFGGWRKKVSCDNEFERERSSPLDQKFLPKVDLRGPKRGEGRPNRFWQEPTPLSIGKCFVLAAHPRRGVPRFFPELASNLVVIVNKTYARNHVYGGLVPWTRNRCHKLRRGRILRSQATQANCNSLTIALSRGICLYCAALRAAESPAFFQSWLPIWLLLSTRLTLEIMFTGD